MKTTKFIIIAVLLPLAALEAIAQEGKSDEEEAKRLIQKKAELAKYALTNSLDHPDVEARLKTVRGFEDFGAIAVDYLLKAVKDDQPKVCRAAIMALTRIGDKKAVKPLRKIWKEENNKSIRIAAACAIAKIAQEEKALTTVISGLKDEEPAIRTFAAEALGEVGCDKAISALVGVLGDEDNSVQDAAAASLVKIDRPAVRALVGALENEKAKVRRIAAKALGAIGDRKAIKPILGLLDDEVAEVRVAAVVALGEIPDEKIVKPVVDALKDKDEKVRRCAREVLVKMREAAIEPLIKMLGENDIVTRFNAADALERITEKDFGIDQDKWKAWYEKNKDK